MTLLNAALAFVFFCNLVFMVGAGYVLMRILDTTETSQINLQKAASSVIEVGSQIRVVVRRAFNEMERNNDALTARESSSGRAVVELASQIKVLVERVKTLMARTSGDRVAAADDGGGEAQIPNAEEFKEKMHAELTAALEKNNKLQDEIDQTKYRLKDASHANAALRDEINEVQGVKQIVVDSLMQRTTDLEDQLEQARERAQAAELHAEANAKQLSEIRTQINERSFSDGVDQSELVEQQQEQIDILAAREKDLLARISQLEGAFQRNLTEKNFIEDRFLQMDAGGSARVPPTPST